MLLTTTLLFAATAGLLELHAKPLQDEILVGEPLKLQVTWRATKRVEVWPERLRLVVTGPGGYREVIEGEVRIEPVRLPTPVEPDSSLVTTMPILHRNYLRDKGSRRSALMFPAAGEYRIQVAYEETQAVSNPAVVHVVAPEGEEAEVFQALHGNAGAPYDERRAAALLSRHLRSRYLRMALLAQITNRLSGINSQEEVGQPLLNLSREERRAWEVREAQRALQELDSGEWGGWEEDALSLAIDAARVSGDSAKAQQLED